MGVRAGGGRAQGETRGANRLHASVSRQTEDLVAEYLVLSSVVLASGHLLAHSVAHCVGRALSQRACRGLHTGSFAPLGVAGGHGVQRTELGHLEQGEGGRG